MTHRQAPSSDTDKSITPQGDRHQGRFRITPERALLAALLLLGILGLLFMNSLISQPKLLFGRSLNAISPSLFPTIIIAAMTGLCLLVLFLSRGQPAPKSSEPTSRLDGLRGAAFFAIMTGYALTMQPLGFLISSTIAIALTSLLLGSRSPLQITSLSITGPVLLYLAASRLLAVSLPERPAIELFYARLLGI